MNLGTDGQIARYTGDIHTLLYNRVGKISKAIGHDDPNSPEVGLWVFLPSEQDMDPVLVRRRDWEEALH
ncbi:hypothetical protein NUH88_17270 [Nisaea acidiphila]|uniref:Uncharacterized protein n=1 Tax=Nisaea acidiphila TaxID=1862145 RepID=A0A9J7APQ4_9PROT|nr:hypothetical protein [Nisaea acidiphila]UUX49142.1 hypothetical protein NUH88_17270 [Nisaea acidiphila]